MAEVTPKQAVEIIQNYEARAGEILNIFGGAVVRAQSTGRNEMIEARIMPVTEEVRAQLRASVENRCTDAFSEEIDVPVDTTLQYALAEILGEVGKLAGAAHFLTGQESDQYQDILGKMIAGARQYQKFSTPAGQQQTER